MQSIVYIQSNQIQVTRQDLDPNWKKTNKNAVPVTYQQVVVKCTLALWLTPNDKALQTQFYSLNMTLVCMVRKVVVY